MTGRKRDWLAAVSAWFARMVDRFRRRERRPPVERRPQMEERRPVLPPGMTAYHVIEQGMAAWLESVQRQAARGRVATGDAEGDDEPE